MSYRLPKKNKLVKRLSVAISPGLLEAIREAAIKEKRLDSNFIRNAVIYYLQIHHDGILAKYEDLIIVLFIFGFSAVAGFGWMEIWL